MKLTPSAQLDTATLARVVAIYEDAFGPELRAPFEELLAEQFLVALDDVGDPCGFAVLRALGPTGWIYLRYFAVGPRGRGVGSAVFDELTRVLADAGHTRLIWDVEDPDDAGLDPAEEHLRRRRIVFYSRLGGQLLEVTDYWTPNGHGGGYPMRLMAHALTPDPALSQAPNPASDVAPHLASGVAPDPAPSQTPNPAPDPALGLTADSTSRISGDDLRDLVLGVYRYRFGLTATDPVVRRTLSSSGLSIPT